MMEMENLFEKYSYDITVDGKLMGNFLEATVSDVISDTIEYREGDFAVNTEGKQAGLIKYGNINLKRGVVSSMELYHWMKEVEQGTIKRGMVSITLHDGLQNEIAKWTAMSAWPTRYDAPDMELTENGMEAEMIELAHEGVTRDR